MFVSGPQVGNKSDKGQTNHHIYNKIAEAKDIEDRRHIGIVRTCFELCNRIQSSKFVSHLAILPTTNAKQIILNGTVLLFWEDVIQ